VTRHSPRHYSTLLGSLAAELGWLRLVGLDLFG